MSAVRRKQRAAIKRLEIPCERLFGAKWLRMARGGRRGDDAAWAIIVAGAEELARKVDARRSKRLSP